MSITAQYLIGRKCSFDYDGKRLTGIITEAKDNGVTARGQIPDFLVTVRGQSGRTATVSLVEDHLSLTES